MAYTARCCCLKAQFIPVGIASVASESFSNSFGFIRFVINRLHSKDWNNTANQVTANEGLVKVSFSSQRVCELELITGDLLWILASSHCM